MAFDLIKSKTLQGRQYQRSNVPDVSLELKKFLSSSTEDQMASLQAEKERLSIAERSERERRRAAEEANVREAAEKESFRAELDQSRKEISAAATDLALIRSQLSEQQKAFAEKEQRHRAVYALIGFLAGVLVWNFNDAVFGGVAERVPALVRWSNYALLGLRGIGALLFSVPTFIFVKHTGWHHSTKIAAYTVVTLLTLVFSKLFDPEIMSSLSGLADVVGLIVLLLAALFLVDTKSKAN